VFAAGVALRARRIRRTAELSTPSRKVPTKKSRICSSWIWRCPIWMASK